MAFTIKKIAPFSAKSGQTSSTGTENGSNQTSAYVCLYKNTTTNKYTDTDTKVKYSGSSGQNFHCASNHMSAYTVAMKRAAVTNSTLLSDFSSFEKYSEKYQEYVRLEWLRVEGSVVTVNNVTELKHFSDFLPLNEVLKVISNSTLE